MQSNLTIALGLGVALSTGCNRIDELWSRAGADSDAATAATSEAPRRPPARNGRRAARDARRHGPDAATTAEAPAANAGATPAEEPSSELAAEPDAGAVAENGAGAEADAGAGETAEAPSATITALWIWVPIYERMDTRGPRLGYMRSGAHVAVEPTPAGTEGCPRGWYAVRGGGYICLNRMASLDPNELGRRAPTQPDLDSPMPYPYYISYRPAVMYRWLPSVADMREVEPERFGITPPGATAALDGGVAAPASATTVSSSMTPAVLSTTAPVTGVLSAGTPQSPDGGATRNPAAATVGNRAQAEDAGVRIEDLAGQSGSPLLRRLLSGMYISVDREATSAGRRFWRTQNGGYIERGAVSPVRSAPTFQGIVLDEAHPLPAAFVTTTQAFTYDLSPDRQSVTRREAAPRLTVFHLESETPVRVGRGEFYRTREGLYVNDRHVRLVRTTPPPADVGATEKWIEVNLDRQMVIAYEGPRAVYATLVSTGRRNTRDDARNYETVQGAFRIQSKHVTTTMDGNSAGDGPYSIEDVPWVMYFENSFALHGAFWHNSFGWMRSHGCVNMAPADARWLFRWSEPALPPGWHGAYASASRPGTRVYVHYERQALGERGGPTVIPPH